MAKTLADGCVWWCDGDGVCAMVVVMVVCMVCDGGVVVCTHVFVYVYASGGWERRGQDPSGRVRVVVVWWWCGGVVV